MAIIKRDSAVYFRPGYTLYLHILARGRFGVVFGFYTFCSLINHHIFIIILYCFTPTYLFDFLLAIMMIKKRFFNYLFIKSGKKLYIPSS